MENMARVTGKKILVTGGAGFIGSHVVDVLVFQKNKVVVIDNLSSGKKEFLNRAAKFYAADVRDYKKMAAIFKKEKPSVVFHFAAQPLVKKAYDNPLPVIETNIMGTVNILELCRKQGNMESIVIVSSDKAYGKAKKLPYTEESALQGDHPYDVSKSAADLIARTYFVTYGIPVTITRFSNVFGPRDTNFSRIIPDIMEAVVKNRPLQIRSDGKMIREYTYVKDIAQGCLMLSSNPKKASGQAFNFGSENIFNVLETVKRVEKILGKKTSYNILNVARNEIPKQYLDWRKAKKMLGWKPTTPFEKAIRETFDWYSSYLKK
jgi:CDP-glucose 4,6-dehydratase